MLKMLKKIYNKLKIFFHNANIENYNTFEQKYIVYDTNKTYDLYKIYFIKSIIANKLKLYNQDSFLLFDPKTLEQNINKWNKFMHKIKPYYAVKSLNYDKVLIKFNNFDCSSIQEIKNIIKIKGSNITDNIIFNNPNKKIVDIIIAKKLNVHLLTFDNKIEYHKIYYFNKECKLILRIDVENNNETSKKFGLKINNCYELINLSINNLAGFSFHLGCSQTNLLSWKNALDKLDILLIYIKNNYPNKYNNVKYINIGGGFTSNCDLELIRNSLSFYIDNKYKDKEWIAEPGRYFSNNILDLVSPVINSYYKNKEQYYVISDSIYKTFSKIIYDNYKLTNNLKNWKLFSQNISFCYGKICGETCDEKDIIFEGIIPKSLFINDIIIFANIGSYSLVSSSNFNSFNLPEIIEY